MIRAVFDLTDSRFTGKSDDLDLWVLSEVMLLLFVYVCNIADLLLLLVNPCQNRIRES